MMRALIVLAMSVFLAGSAAAHTRSQSASDWTVEGAHLSGSFSIDARRATLLYGLNDEEGVDLEAALVDHLSQSVEISQEGATCAPDGAPVPQAAAAGYLRVHLAFTCPGDILEGGADMNMGAFFDLSAAHLHIIRVRSGEGLILEQVLSGVGHQIHLGGAEVLVSGGQRLYSFVRTGVIHVLSGWDHLAFLAALLLLAGRLKPIIVTITGFTVGHSLTMALVALGVLRPYGIAVEVLIGFSIAYAAMEAGARGLFHRDRIYLWVGVALFGACAALLALCLGQIWPPVLAVLAASWFVASQAPMRGAGGGQGWSWRAPALAGLFGLAHGAGFAGALLEYDLHGPGLLWSLFGFNVGVELGQLFAVVVILLGVTAFGRLMTGDVGSYRVPIAAGLFGLGVFWTISRLVLVG